MFKTAATAASLALASTTIAQDTHRFNLAPIGLAYTAVLFDGTPIVGRDVVSARIEIHVNINPGHDAADFWTDIGLPIRTPSGEFHYFTFGGNDAQWSGEGEFHYSATTTALNGTISPTYFGAETFGVQGFYTQSSFIEVTFAPGNPNCPADLDNGSATGAPDGSVTIDDLLFFLDRFAIGDLAVDLDDGTTAGAPDGAVTIDDLLYMLDHFQAGC